MGDRSMPSTSTLIGLRRAFLLVDPRGRLLVVDDEADIGRTLKGLLEGVLPVDVVVASSGAEGVEALRSQVFDLVISDFRMPLMDGLEFLRRAKELQPQTPRVLMTAYPDMDVAFQALERASIVQFVTKPVDPDRLIELVRSNLEDVRRGRARDAAFRRAAGPRAGA